MMEYTDMTDEEYDALDEELTRTVPGSKRHGLAGPAGNAPYGAVEYDCQLPYDQGNG